MEQIAWLLSWFPGWSVTWLAGTLAVAGIVAFLYSRFFAVSPYAAAAAVLGPLALVAAAFLFGVGSAQSVQEARLLATENRVLKARIATVEQLRADDAKRAEADDVQNSQNEEKVNATPPNDALALPRAVVGRVRDVR